MSGPSSNLRAVFERDYYLECFNLEHHGTSASTSGFSSINMPVPWPYSEWYVCVYVHFPGFQTHHKDDLSGRVCPTG